MGSQHHYMRPSTSLTTQIRTKDGGKPPSKGRKSGSTCSPSNKDGTFWRSFDPAPLNQTTWGGSLHLRVHPYPMQMRWIRRHDQGRKEDLQWPMMNLPRDINRTKNRPF